MKWTPEKTKLHKVLLSAISSLIRQTNTSSLTLSLPQNVPLACSRSNDSGGHNLCTICPADFFFLKLGYFVLVLFFFFLHAQDGWPTISLNGNTDRPRCYLSCQIICFGTQWRSLTAGPNKKTTQFKWYTSHALKRKNNKTFPIWKQMNKIITMHMCHKLLKSMP